MRCLTQVHRITLLLICIANFGIWASCKTDPKFVHIQVRAPSSLPQLYLGESRDSVLQQWKMLEHLNFDIYQHKEYISRYDVYGAKGYLQLSSDTIGLSLVYVLSEDRLVRFGAHYYLDVARSGEYEKEIGRLLGIAIDSSCHTKRNRLDLVRNNIIEESISCNPTWPREVGGRELLYNVYYTWFEY